MGIAGEKNVRRHLCFLDEDRLDLADVFECARDRDGEVHAEARGREVVSASTRRKLGGDLGVLDHFGENALDRGMDVFVREGRGLA